MLLSTTEELQGFTVTDICALILMLGSVLALFILCTGAVWSSTGLRWNHPATHRNDRPHVAGVE